MKRIFMIMCLIAAVALIGCSNEVEARGYQGNPCDTALGSILNECLVVEHPDNPEVEPNREEFDYGAYLHLILWESKGRNIEIGNWNTYEVQREEITSLIGAKIYLNRLFYQKDK